MIANLARHRTENRVGLYAWGGPDTIRMTRLKYGDRSRVDEASFLTLYDPPALAHLRGTLGVTDMWVTFSWGFGDAAEREQRSFLRSKLPNFRAAGIATHAYVQGFNVVTDDFSERDFFCRDTRGRLLPYSRQRSLICPNAPQTLALLTERVRAACNEDVDGIFIDNMLFGLPPTAVYGDYLPPFGCACRWCREAFLQRYGEPLPMRGFRGRTAIGNMLRFRAESVSRAIGACSGIVRERGKQFGVNLYDPLHHTPEVFFGYGLASLDPHLDYRLIENHALRRDGSLENDHLAPLIDGTKPLFVVSYRKGIGRDGAYAQRDIDAIIGDAQRIGYAPCLKASEYVTRGIWHALRWESIAMPGETLRASHARKTPSDIAPKRSTAWRRATAYWTNACIRSAARGAFAWGPMRAIIARSPLYTYIVRRPRRFCMQEWGLS